MGGGTHSMVKWWHRSRRIAFAMVLLASAPIAGRGGTAAAHPLHTSLAEVKYDARRGTIDVSLRVFTDDFTTAATRFAKRRGQSASHPAFVMYALAAFTITDAAGGRVVLQPCGERRAGDLTWLCFRGRARPGAALRVTSRVLFDLFTDQINIVRAEFGGKKASFLFTPGDGAKPLN